MYPALGEFSEHIHSGLDVLDLVLQDILGNSCERCSGECGNENSLRFCGRIRQNTVRPLDKSRPETALEKEGLDVLC